MEDNMPIGAVTDTSLAMKPVSSDDVVVDAPHTFETAPTLSDVVEYLFKEDEKIHSRVDELELSALSSRKDLLVRMSLVDQHCERLGALIVEQDSRIEKQHTWLVGLSVTCVVLLIGVIALVVTA